MAASMPGRRIRVVANNGGVIDDRLPPASTLAWVAEAAGARGAHVVRRLYGGTHAVTHLIETTGPARHLVLRRFPPGDAAAAREAAALTALDGLGGWAPRPVG